MGDTWSRKPATDHVRCRDGWDGSRAQRTKKIRHNNAEDRDRHIVIASEMAWTVGKGLTVSRDSGISFGSPNILELQTLALRFPYLGLSKVVLIRTHNRNEEESPLDQSPWKLWHPRETSAGSELIRCPDPPSKLPCVGKIETRAPARKYCSSKIEVDQKP